MTKPPWIFRDWVKADVIIKAENANGEYNKNRARKLKSYTHSINCNVLSTSDPYISHTLT